VAFAAWNGFGRTQKGLLESVLISISAEIFEFIKIFSCIMPKNRQLKKIMP